MSDLDRQFMRKALARAAWGEGAVEPNPMVGCVIVRDLVDPDFPAGLGTLSVGVGHHERYGGPHAEIEALRNAGEEARGSTMYVTLEPCCHFGKTPPCSQAVIAAGVKRVVIAMRDPNPVVAGKGVAELRAAGIVVEVGLLAEEAEQVLAPYLKLVRTGRPWVIAKWAMTLDGKIATRTGESKWISGPESRAIVQQLRGRVDAILIGSRTAKLDDPLLTARLEGGANPLRVATRVVLDSSASLAIDSQLVRTAREVPLLVAAAKGVASPARVDQLRSAGAEVVLLPGESATERLDQLLVELGNRRFTNVLCEGGGQLLGALFDIGQVNEVHAFVAPKILGGQQATGPVGGEGVFSPAAAVQLQIANGRMVGEDYYCHGRVKPRP